MRRLIQLAGRLTAVGSIELLGRPGQQYCGYRGMLISCCKITLLFKYSSLQDNANLAAAKKNGRGLGDMYDIHGLNQVGENACLTTAVTKFLPDLATQLDVKSLYHLYLIAYIYTSAISQKIVY